MPEPEPDTNGDVYKTAIKAISDHFGPQKCVDHHVYNFRKEASAQPALCAETHSRGIYGINYQLIVYMLLVLMCSRIE